MVRAGRKPLFNRLTEVMRISGVPVYLHWSLLAIGALILIGALQRPAEMLCAGLAYFGVFLIHECGHMYVARKKGCRVMAIELYPIHGKVRYEEPWSRYDDSLIAWGGVAAQSVVAFPLLALVAIFGFTPFDDVNVVIGILSYFSLAMAVFNLFPVPPLDGATAWFLIPELIKCARQRGYKRKRGVGWRGW